VYEFFTKIEILEVKKKRKEHSRIWTWKNEIETYWLDHTAKFDFQKLNFTTGLKKKLKNDTRSKRSAHTWIHCSGNPAGTTPDVAQDGFGLIFVAPAAEDAFHKSIPMFKLVAGIDTAGFPGTEAWIFAPAEVLCALAVKKVNMLASYHSKQTKTGREKKEKCTICKHLVEASLLACTIFLEYLGRYSLNKR